MCPVVAVRRGYPPKAVSGTNPAATLAEMGITSGNALVVSIEDGGMETAASTWSAAAPSGARSDGVARGGASGIRDAPGGSHAAGGAGGTAALPAGAGDVVGPDPQIDGWTCAACTYVNRFVARSCHMCDRARPLGAMKRRVVPADNTCMFYSVAHLVHGGDLVSSTAARKLRALVARVISSDVEKYSEVVLDKPNSEYCEWIQKDSSWGGGIELGILSDHFAVEIVALDIKTQRPTTVGTEKGYTRRIYLVYDGIHYDPVTRDPASGEAGDAIRLFAPGDSAAEADALDIVKGLHEQHAFTDLQGFTLRCLVCAQGVKGQAEAVVHARETGHQNFGEYA